MSWSFKKKRKTELFRVMCYNANENPCLKYLTWSKRGVCQPCIDTHSWLNKSGEFNSLFLSSFLRRKRRKGWKTMLNSIQVVSFSRWYYRQLFIKSSWEYFFSFVFCFCCSRLTRCLTFTFFISVSITIELLVCQQFSRAFKSSRLSDNKLDYNLKLLDQRTLRMLILWNSNFVFIYQNWTTAVQTKSFAELGKQRQIIMTKWTNEQSENVKLAKPLS